MDEKLVRYVQICNKCQSKEEIEVEQVILPASGRPLYSIWVRPDFGETYTLNKIEDGKDTWEKVS